ncbi:MAG TPA: glutamate carboxypeptidase [Rhizomicrobium sp.]|jgi:glutamate carboxypeptidase
MRAFTTGLAIAAAVATMGASAPGGTNLWAEAQAVKAEQLQFLSTLVNIDSGTGDEAGGRKVEALLMPKLRALGASITTVPAEADGLPPNLVATWSGTGTTRILMIGHIDTVFGPGTVATRPYHVEGDHARGPGVADEKGGVVEGLYAMKLLRKAGFKNFKTITFLMETSEEKGSPGTRKLIQKLVGDADVEFNLEPGDPPDLITVWRKGSATFHIDVKGKAAHAGVNPQDGHNAAVELLHQLAGIEAFPHWGPGLTVNLTLMSAGTRANIIPDAASAQVNVRVRDMADFDKVERALVANSKHVVVPGTSVTVSREPAFPPLPDNKGTSALATRAEKIYAAIGMRLDEGGNGGASESALAAAAGVPALDGLGPVGGGFHSSDEYLDLNSVSPRLYLLTRLLMDVGETPPVPK